MTNKEKALLIKVLKYGGRFGDTITDLAAMCGCSHRSLTSIVSQYAGKQFKGGTIHFTSTHIRVIR